MIDDLDHNFSNNSMNHPANYPVSDSETITCSSCGGLYKEGELCDNCQGEFIQLKHNYEMLKLRTKSLEEVLKKYAQGLDDGGKAAIAALDSYP